MSQIPDPIANTLMRSLSGALTASGPSDRVPHVKQLIARLWRMLPPDDRRTFIGQADPDSETGFLEFKPRWPKLDDDELERAARAWPQIAAYYEGGRGFEADFVNSTQARLTSKDAKTKSIPPSEKQREQMKRIYREWRARL